MRIEFFINEKVIFLLSCIIMVLLSKDSNLVFDLMIIMHQLTMAK